MLLVLTLLGCGPKHNASVTAGYVGAWADPSGSVTTIELRDGLPEVVSIIDYDGEQFSVQWSKYKAGALSWHYLVPSTDFLVTVTTTSLEGDLLCTAWSNADASGEECYTRR